MWRWHSEAVARVPLVTAAALSARMAASNMTGLGFSACTCFEQTGQGKLGQFQTHVRRLITPLHPPALHRSSSAQALCPWLHAAPLSQSPARLLPRAPSPPPTALLPPPSPHLRRHHHLVEQPLHRQVSQQWPQPCVEVGHHRRQHARVPQPLQCRHRACAGEGGKMGGGAGCR